MDGLKLVYLSGRSNAEISAMITQSKHFAMTPSPERAHIIMFQGGGDVNPKFYGEEPIQGVYLDPAHDKVDLDNWNRYPEKPKVGICRGGQFLNIMSGGEMWQDVDNHGLSGTHDIINLMPLADFDQGDVLSVTSTHHQMMVPHKEYGEVLAFADRATSFKQGKTRDGNIRRPKPEFDTEVVWYEHTKCLCFQPHPEYARMPEKGRKYFFDLMEHFL